MSDMEQITELNPHFSSEEATPTPWPEAREHLEKAEVHWLSTVHRDGRSHVTPMVGVWLNDALYFCTGPGERKAKNLSRYAHSVITTECNTLSESLDLVLEGEVVQVSDEVKLQSVADRFATKYEPPFNFTLRDLVELLVYKVKPAKAFGFGKGKTFSQTRWRFQRASTK